MACQVTIFQLKALLSPVTQASDCGRSDDARQRFPALRIPLVTASKREGRGRREPRNDRPTPLAGPFFKRTSPHLTSLYFALLSFTSPIIVISSAYATSIEYNTIQYLSQPSTLNPTLDLSFLLGILSQLCLSHQYKTNLWCSASHLLRPRVAVVVSLETIRIISFAHC
jgi:hypothetical protein